MVLGEEGGGVGGGGFVGESLGGAFAQCGCGDGGEDEAADNILPVFVATLECIFHGCQVC